jgi:hypothetical protein
MDWEFNMPFFRPFREKFEKRDLVYGLNEMRDKYIREYTAFHSVDDKRDFIDSYNITPYEMIDTFQTVKAKRRRHLLKTIKAHPKNVIACKTPPYIFTLNNRRYPLENTAAITRKAKAGLRWSAQSITTDKAFHIHFILDNICFTEVVFKESRHDKEFDSFKSFLTMLVERDHQDSINLSTLNYNSAYDNCVIKHRSVTGTELRWIYRNRHDTNVQNAVQFWYEGRPCCPPWDPEFDAVSDSTLSLLWKLYRPKSESRV